MIREGGTDLSTKKTKPMAGKHRSHVRMLIYRILRGGLIERLWYLKLAFYLLANKKFSPNTRLNVKG